jgi:hypothetical protein
MTQPGSLLRIASQWVLGLALVAALTLFFFTLAGLQLTSESTGERILRRAVAIATEIDVNLPQIESDLRETAAGRQGERVLVPNFPIPVELTIEEATTLGGAELRSVILTRAGERLYRDGSSAWAGADPEGNQQVQRISSAGVLHSGLGLLTKSTNTVFLITSILFGLLALGLAALLMVSLRGYMRLLVAGVVTLASSLPLLAGAVALRFIMRTAEPEGDAFVQGLLDLGVDAMWVPIRDYAALSVLGALLTLVGALLLWWQSRAQTRFVDAGHPSPL